MDKNIQESIINYLESQPKKIVRFVSREKIEYGTKIKKHRNIKSISGDEEFVRGYLLTKLINELGYREENIEIEKGYDIGRPKVNKPRIDVIVRDEKGNAFLYIELKSPQDYEKDKDQVNELYRRALKQRLNITDDAKLKKSFVIDENKLSLSKLKYAVSELEGFSFVDGKNSFDGKDRKKLPSIKGLKESEEKTIQARMLKDYIEEDDKKLSAKELVEKYKDELKELCKYDNDTKDAFGFVNTWWVFGEVAKELNYKIFMAEVENIGYKRTKRGEKPMPNELYRTNDKGEVLVDDKIIKTALDYMRKIEWE